MSGPTNPTPNGNPFLANPPVVMVVRHVRITGSGEVVAENANNLPRYFAREVQPRAFPQRMTTQAVARTFPNVGNTKKPF